MAKAKSKTQGKTTSNKKIIAIGLAVLLLLLVGYKIVKSTNPLAPLPAPTLTPSLAAQVTVSPIISSNPNAQCHINGVLPDPACTPGSSNPNVTQANIQQTICVSGFTQTIRPPVSFTNNLKVQQIAQYGYADINLHDYEEDHLISLELGGAPADPKNLWPEPGGSPNPKDHIENLCHKKVCDGEITLATAQHEIATNWQNACQ